ncbi:katanin p60 ATPase-containing subunit A1-like [Chlorella sorokiniana]|uniref:Katanin p60 ATPase-containing subunit A1-like n=1 Tax=Chlorella sorokiniana TaxID=3076 RepID=A0A2P6TDW2_CHLSO|nr:katanin p60 ATPase-containing subunit A1-like [Chlorella sorokiniana]|eukprot:PRW20821.1 katanin p60 ATPase-containing subunit A1-like [Chlorella sorokiniana]
MAAAHGLVALYSQLESARSLAAAGDFEAGRAGYTAVEAGLRAVAGAAHDPAAAQGWAALLSQLREERELLAAFESECTELEALADQVERPSAPSYTSAPPPVNAHAFNIDLRSFQCEELPPRPQQHATPPAPQRDPDVWSPADPAADSGAATPPLGSAYRGREASWRERGEAYERLRRDSLTLGAGSAAKRGGPFSGIKPRVNTGAKRVPAGGSMDPKCAILDLMLDRYSGADHDLIQQLSRDVLDAAPGVTWDDIAGLDQAKEVLRENVSMPLLMRDLFAAVPCLRPLKGVLLFGPPGTGKTMLAKAVATAGSTAEARTAFINVSASTLASKYRGESEKLVRFLFEIARAVQPCVVFIDEIDSLCGERGSQNEHEASRRMKTELLTQAASSSSLQIDGMHSGGGGEAAPRVMVLAATNYPWQIDEALRRRLEKRIFIGLPAFEERVALLRLKLKGMSLAPDVDLQDIARRTEGYSGDDIANVCNEAAHNLLRRMLAGRSVNDMTEAERRERQAAIQATMLGGSGGGGVSRADFLYALERSNPSCSTADVERHQAFAQTYGCT